MKTFQNWKIKFTWMFHLHHIVCSSSLDTLENVINSHTWVQGGPKRNILIVQRENRCWSVLVPLWNWLSFSRWSLKTNRSAFSLHFSVGFWYLIFKYKALYLSVKLNFMVSFKRVVLELHFNGLLQS